MKVKGVRITAYDPARRAPVVDVDSVSLAIALEYGGHVGPVDLVAEMNGDPPVADLRYRVEVEAIEIEVPSVVDTRAAEIAQARMVGKVTWGLPVGLDQTAAKLYRAFVAAAIEEYVDAL